MGRDVQRTEIGVGVMGTVRCPAQAHHRARAKCCGSLRDHLSGTLRRVRTARQGWCGSRADSWAPAGQFDHHTSRELDPQLHTHVFVFNLAPRKDGTWGAIVSRNLYKAQKQAGAVYREALATELERAGHTIERTSINFRVATIPRDIERAFSKRRAAIESAAEAHGYRSAKGMELAALRTRLPKRDVSRQQLFEAWRAEAKALGFDLSRAELIRSTSREGHARSVPDNPRSVMVANVRTERPEALVRAAIGELSNAARALDQRASMPGVAVELAQREGLTKRRSREPERQ